MKLILCLVFLLGIVSARAEDWTTIGGKQYPDVNVLKVEPDAVTVLYRDGGALIPLAELPENLQQRFHYDPAAAKKAADARDQADFENARALREEYRQIESRQEAAQNAPADSSDTDGDATLIQTNQTHHTMSELVASMGSLRADNSTGTHYSAASAVTPGPISRAPADPNHHSVNSVFGSGDALAPASN